MNAIALSHKFENVGFKSNQAEVLAQAFEEHEKELATRADLNLAIKGVRELLYLIAGGLGAMSIYGITQIHLILTKI